MCETFAVGTKSPAQGVGNRDVCDKKRLQSTTFWLPSQFVSELGINISRNAVRPSQR